jgi:hypothetical protein
MALSRAALQALEAAVQLNPAGAQALVAVIRTAPAAVKYKPKDRFGPLGMMVVDRRQAPEDPTSTLRGFSRPPLPTKFHPAAEAFQREWLAKSFSKDELADALERCLRQLGETVSTSAGPWRTIRRNSDSDTHPDPLRQVFPSDSD